MTEELIGEKVTSLEVSDNGKTISWEDPLPDGEFVLVKNPKYPSSIFPHKVIPEDSFPFVDELDELNRILPEGLVVEENTIETKYGEMVTYEIYHV